MQYRRLGPNGPQVSAIGLGGMLLSIQGRPPREGALQLIRSALDQGINFIDTADAYCLDESDFNHNEALVREALQGRSERVLVATKCACIRPGGAWRVDARPEYLKQAAERSLKALGVERIDLLQLHAPDTRVPFADSVGALAELRQRGLVERIGLSNVEVSHIEQARKIVPIASVQNRWNASDRSPEKSGVLAYCEKHEIAFIPFSPFGGSREAPELGLGRLGQEAKRRRLTAYRLVLAWMLAKSPVTIPVFGARRIESVTDTMKALNVHLTADDIIEIEAALPAL